jgi:tetratricopeptide (TPR) repeat protein
MSLAPRSDRVVGWCAYLALVVGRLHEAIAIDEKLDRRTRLRPYWSYLMQSYHQLGQHQRELAVAQEARRVFPGEMQALRWETNALVGLGRLADVNAQVEEMARLPREVSQNSSFVDYLTQIGLDLRAHGYRKESQAVLERGIRWIKARPAAEQRNLQQDLANALYFVERWDEAHRILKQLAAENPDDMGYRADLGAVAAHRGDRREVARIDRWLAARKGPYLNGGHTFHRARLAAILKDRERAVELYRQALAEGFGGTYDGYGTAHTDPDFESLRDYPPFQELTRPKD